MEARTQKLLAALAAYVMLAALAALTTEGIIRVATVIFLAGLAVKTLIAHKAGWS